MTSLLWSGWCHNVFLFLLPNLPISRQSPPHCSSHFFHLVCLSFTPFQVVWVHSYLFWLSIYTSIYLNTKPNVMMFHLMWYLQIFGHSIARKPFAKENYVYYQIKILLNYIYLQILLYFNSENIFLYIISGRRTSGESISAIELLQKVI